jgi:hypothetical protein
LFTLEKSSVFFNYVTMNSTIDVEILWRLTCELWCMGVLQSVTNSHLFRLFDRILEKFRTTKRCQGILCPPCSADENPRQVNTVHQWCSHGRQPLSFCFPFNDKESAEVDVINRSEHNRYLIKKQIQGCQRVV